MSKSQEVMDRIAETIIKTLEEGASVGKWEKPWVHRNQHGGGIPTNAITRKQYTGGNIFYLWIIAWTDNRTSGEWATYKQWESIGAQVRKGEKGTATIRWNVLPCKDHGPDERCMRCGRMVPNVFTLFNADQVDGYEPKDRVTVDETFRNPEERIPSVESFFANMGSNVCHGGDNAAYQPQADRISMPDFESFVDAASYYGTLAHEHIHWTGASHRLDRELVTNHSDDRYAAEELVAELGAAMLCGVLGIEDTPRQDHAQYLAHWLRILRDDHKMLWSAASKATKAVEFLQARAPSNLLATA